MILYCNIYALACLILASERCDVILSIVHASLIILYGMGILCTKVVGFKVFFVAGLLWLTLIVLINVTRLLVLKSSLSSWLNVHFRTMISINISDSIIMFTFSVTSLLLIILTKCFWSFFLSHY